MAIDYTAHKTKLLGAMIKRYNQLDILKDSILVSYDDLGETSVHPEMSADEDAINVSDDTPQDSSSETVAGQEISLELPIRKAYPIPTSQQEDLKFEQLSFYGEKIGNAIVRGRALRPLLLMAGSGATTITGDFLTASTLRATVEAAVQEAASIFSGASEVPDDGEWFGLLKSKQFYSLFGAEGIFARDSGGEGSIAESNERAGVKFCGFRIRTSNRPFGTDFTQPPWTTRLLAKYQVNCVNLVGIFWHKEAVRMRQTKRKPDANIDWQGPVGKYQHLVSGRVRIGTKVAQLPGIVLLADDGV